MKRYKIKILSSIILVFAFFACTSEYEEMNSDPNSLTEVPYKTLLTNAEISICRTYFNVNSHWISWARYNVRDVYQHNDRYQIDGSLTSFSEYNGHLKNIQLIIDLAPEKEDNNTLAVAMILKAYAFQNLTDWFGDIPYSEALKADANPQIVYPKYDSQESIYTDLIEQLKAANSLIDVNANIGSADVIFNGDMGKWKKFCNSLLLRVYMRISKVKPDIAKSGIETIMGNSANFPIITSNLDNAFKYWIPGDAAYRSPSWMNPVNAETQERVSAKFMIDFLKSRNDDRLPVYAEPAKSTGEYEGLVMGTEGFSTQDLSIMGIAEFRSEDSPTRMMRCSEVMFILAEAALNGWNVGITAKEAYEAGISSSFEEYGLAIGDYLSNPLVDFDGSTPQRELIGDQKWIALYPDGTQGWAEIRRTKYPTYVFNTEPVQNLFPGRGYIKRLPYPYSEAVINKESLAAAIAAQPGIIDEKFGAGVWWDVN